MKLHEDSFPKCWDIGRTCKTLGKRPQHLRHCPVQVMFGSTFPNDLSDMFVAMNLQRCLVKQGHSQSGSAGQGGY